MIINRLSKREKIFLLITIIVVSSVFGYALILEPLARNWSRLNRQVVQRSRRLNQNLLILKKERKIKNEFAKYAEYAKSLGTDEEIIAYLLKTIEQKASLTSTYITNIRPRDVKDKGFYREFIFELISESGLDDLMKFIYELQNSSELLTVKRLTLTLKSSERQVLRGVIEISKISVK